MSDTQQPNETTPLTQGTVAVLTADTPADWHERFREGFVFEVESYLEALKPGEEGYGEEDWIQGPIYYGNADGGFNNVCVPAGIVAAHGVPALPSHETVVSEVASALHGGREDGYRIHSTYVDEDTVLVEATSDAGFPFSFEVTVSRLERQ